MYDCIIAGAGPAGGQLARILSKNGLKILLIDKAKELGEPIYSTAITPAEMYKDFDLDISLTHQALYSWVLYGPNSKAEFKYDYPIAYTLNLRDFKQELAKQSIDAGADVLVDTQVKEPIIRNNKIVGVRYGSINGNQEVLASMMVDATGHSADLATKIGLREQTPKRLLIGLEYLMENLDLPEDGKKVELFFGKKYLPAGYAWIAPTDKREAKVGVGIIKDFVGEENIEEIQNSFIKNYHEIANGQTIEVHSGILFANGGISNHAADNFLVIGDAAVQVNPLVGEGIRHCQHSAQFAAETILDAFKNKDFSKRRLSVYNKKWQQYTGNSWKYGVKLRDYAARLDDSKVDIAVNKLAKLSPDIALRLIKGQLNWKDTFRFGLKII